MRSKTFISRHFVVAGLVSACLLTGASSASAQSGGTVAPGGGSAAATGPVGKAKLLKSGRALAPSNAPQSIVNAIEAGNRIRKKPYIWGGGHASFDSKGYDCSGAVSYVLHAAGVLSSPLVSGQLAFWGLPGPGTWITVYANRTHTYMYIAGLRYDTSPLGESVDQGRGPRWRYTLRTGTGFAVRHYTGL